MTKKPYEVIQVLPSTRFATRESHDLAARMGETRLPAPRASVVAGLKEVMVSRATTAVTKQEAIQSGHLLTIEKNFSAIGHLRMENVIAVEQARLTVAQIQAAINVIEREDFKEKELAPQYFALDHDKLAADRRDLAREWERKDSDHEVHLARNGAVLYGIRHPGLRAQEEARRGNVQALAEQIVTEVSGGHVPCDSQHLHHALAALTLRNHFKDGKSPEEARHLTIRSLMQRLETYPITDVAEAAQQKQQLLDAVQQDRRDASARAAAGAQQSERTHSERLASIEARKGADFAKAFGGSDDDFFH